MINTVNVIDCRDVSSGFRVECLKSFPDTPEGNKEASSLFRSWVEEQFDDEVPKDHWEIIENDGVFTIGDGFIALVRST